MAHVLMLLVLVLSTAGAGSGAPPALSPVEREAEAHYLEALRCFEKHSLDYRQQGLHELEEAVRLAPANTTYRLALANLHFIGGSYHAARRDYERVAASDSAAAYLNLGMLWRRDWLATNDARSLDRAVDAVMTAAWLDPSRTDAWLLLVPLYLAQHKRAEAASAAFSALESDPGRLEAHLAVAATLCHLGVVSVGDSIFRATIPRLAPDLRATFERGAPVPADAEPIASAAPLAGASAGVVSLDPAVEERLWSWSRTTEEVALLPAGQRPRPGARRGQGGGSFAWSPRGDRSQDPSWQSAELGVRMEILGRLLAFGPDLTVSRTRPGTAPPTAVLATMYARILAALGGAQPEGGVPSVGTPTSPQK